MTLREKQSKFWKMVALFILFSEKVLNQPIVILDWDRTEKEQAVLVARNASKTMKSKHVEGLAIDMCFLGDLQDDGKINWDKERYRPLGEFWEKLGGRWGGRFGDDPNTEKIEGWDVGHMEYKD